MCDLSHMDNISPPTPDLVEFCELINATRDVLKLDNSPDSVDVVLGVLREFRAFIKTKPKEVANIVSITANAKAAYAESGDPASS